MDIKSKLKMQTLSPTNLRLSLDLLFCDPLILSVRILLLQREGLDGSDRRERPRPTLSISPLSIQLGSDHLTYGALFGDRRVRKPDPSFIMWPYHKGRIFQDDPLLLLGNILKYIVC